MITHEILGDDMQAVVLTLGDGDVVRAEAGALMFMNDAVEMDARMDGGLLGGLKRKFLAGESLFITYFKGTAAGAKVAFAGPYPGKIIHIALSGQPVLCQRDASVRPRRRGLQHRVHEAARGGVLRWGRLHPPEDGRAW